MDTGPLAVEDIQAVEDTREPALLVDALGSEEAVVAALAQAFDATEVNEGAA